MKVTFLGTAAATACPLPFCRCSACMYARARGGKDLRKRSSVMINDDLLIDIGPDVFTAAAEYGKDISNVKFLLQTHSHSDHFDAGHFITRMRDYATENIMPMEIAASRECLIHMSEKLAREEDGATLMTEEWQERLAVKIHTVSRGDVVNFGRYEITCVESAHDVNDKSLLYIIREGESEFFYATDTIRFTPAARDIIRKHHINAMAIDMCYGPNARGGGHLCAEEAAEEVAFANAGIAYATHISHEGTPPHDELEKWTKAHGFETAFDGLTIDI